MKPFFSLILPCWNVENYVGRCVQSILSQDFADYEIILVDDGSTDRTGEICRALTAEDSRIRVVSKANGGLSSARNAGLEAAAGQYVWFIDSDDWIEDNALPKLYEACREDEPDVVKFDHYRVEEEARLVSFAVEPGLYREAALEALKRDAFCNAGRFGLSACMHVYRRELLQKHGLLFVPEKQVGSEDYLFNLQLLLHIRCMKVLREPLYSYERRDGSLTQTYKADLAARYIALWKQLKAYYAAHQAGEGFDALIDRFFVWHLIIGTCVTQEYDTVSAQRPMQEARHMVRGLLKMKETRQAARKASQWGLTWKKKLILLALRLGIEPLFYRVYAVNPAKGS